MKRNESVDKLFGKNLKNARERFGYSQQALADQLEQFYDLTWHQTTVGKTEAGTRPAKLHEAVALANILGVAVSDLLAEKPDEERKKASLHRAMSELQMVQDTLSQRTWELQRELIELRQGRFDG